LEVWENTVITFEYGLRVDGQIVDASPEGEPVTVLVGHALWLPPVELGLVDPVPVTQGFLSTEWCRILKLDGIVCVADARNLERTVAENPEGRSQLASTRTSYCSTRWTLSERMPSKLPRR
jgi:hypothetical protein